MSILMHNHIDSFSLCQYSSMKKKNEICIVLQIYSNLREAMPEKSDQELWHRHRSRFAQLFHLLNFCVAVMNAVYNIQTTQCECQQKHVFLRKFSEFKKPFILASIECQSSC